MATPKKPETTSLLIGLQLIAGHRGAGHVHLISKCGRI
jgi:hypothetical protein